MREQFEFTKFSIPPSDVRRIPASLCDERTTRWGHSSSVRMRGRSSGSGQTIRRNWNAGTIVNQNWQSGWEVAIDARWRVRGKTVCRAAVDRSSTFFFLEEQSVYPAWYSRWLWGRGRCLAWRVLIVDARAIRDRRWFILSLGERWRSTSTERVAGRKRVCARGSVKVNKR